MLTRLGGFHSDVALATVEVTAEQGTPRIVDEAVSSEIVTKINEQELWNVFKTTPPSEAYADRLATDRAVPGEQDRVLPLRGPDYRAYRGRYVLRPLDHGPDGE